MTHSELTDLVRRVVAQSFAEMQPSAVGPVRETILLRGDSYCGRRFDAEGGHAIWFVEEDQIKIYSEGGRRLVRTLSISALQGVRPRLAA